MAAPAKKAGIDAADCSSDGFCVATESCADTLELTARTTATTEPKRDSCREPCDRRRVAQPLLNCFVATPRVAHGVRRIRGNARRRMSMLETIAIILII